LVARRGQGHGERRHHLDATVIEPIDRAFIQRTGFEVLLVQNVDAERLVALHASLLSQS